MKIKDTIRRKDISADTKAKALAEIDEIVKIPEYDFRDDEFLDSAFTWNDTPSGHAFWEKIHYAKNLPEKPKITEYTVTLESWNKLVMEKLAAERTLTEIKKICKVGVKKGNKNYKEEHHRGVRKIAEHILKVIKKQEKKEEKNDI